MCMTHVYVSLYVCPICVYIASVYLFFHCVYLLYKDVISVRILHRIYMSLHAYVPLLDRKEWLADNVIGKEGGQVGEELLTM